MQLALWSLRGCMANKIPLLSKTHRLIIFLAILVAGLLGVSPSLLGASATDGSSDILDLPARPANHDNISQQVQAAGGIRLAPYKYTLVMIMKSGAFSIQSGSPAYLANFTNPAAGCNWMGVAGQVFGSDGNPISGLSVEIIKTVNGQSIKFGGVTGEAQVYGTGGYEIQISNVPISSTGIFQVTLYDQDLKPLTSPIFLTTYQDCARNLILLNFVSTR